MPTHNMMPRGFGLLHLFQTMATEKFPMTEAVNVLQRLLGGEHKFVTNWVKELKRDIKKFNQSAVALKKRSRSRAQYR
jgi:hypothetical protein